MIDGGDSPVIIPTPKWHLYYRDLVGSFYFCAFSEASYIFLYLFLPCFVAASITGTGVIEAQN
jgi:hypothetical protein